LPVSEHILYKQPDLVLAWNIRRENFCRINLEKELDLTFLCLKENPKSYSVWFHRRCVLDEMASNSGNVDDLKNNVGNLDLGPEVENLGPEVENLGPEVENSEPESKPDQFKTDPKTPNLTPITPHPCYKKELQTVDWYLNLDQRNFHAWDHRRWLITKLNRSVDQELTVTKTLIDKDFSNHSAWHYRSSLLKQKHGEKLNIEAIKSELTYVTNAFYVDPEDQAGWIYYDWLLSICPESLIEAQVVSLQDLDECEPGSKYVMLKLLKIGGDRVDRKKLVSELIRIDKQRRNYYETLGV